MAVAQRGAARREEGFVLHKNQNEYKREIHQAQE
jgi:hypothetical protein